MRESLTSYASKGNKHLNLPTVSLYGLGGEGWAGEVVQRFVRQKNGCREWSDIIFWCFDVHLNKRHSPFMHGKISQADSGPCRLQKSDNLELKPQVHDDKDNYFNAIKSTQ